MEAQLQEFGVRVCCDLWVLYCVLLQWFITWKPQRRVLLYNYNTSTCFCLCFSSSISLPSSSCSLPFLSPPHFFLLYSTFFCLSRVWTEVSTPTPRGLSPWILLERSSSVAQTIPLRSKRTLKDLNNKCVLVWKCHTILEQWLVMLHWQLSWISACQYCMAIDSVTK